MQAITSAVVINVGGKQFHTTMNTLNKSPFFQAMFRCASIPELKRSNKNQ
jgi:hypothetical protein